MIGFYLLVTACILVLGPTQPPIQGEVRIFMPGVKFPGREANHLPSSSAKVKNG
jgi:hypothetical protein